MILPQHEQCSCRCIHQGRIDNAHEHALDPKENEQLAALFKAMGGNRRVPSQQML